MKTTFKLESFIGSIDTFAEDGAIIQIIGTVNKNERPYVSIALPHDKGLYFIKDKDLKRFAENILKALA